LVHTVFPGLLASFLRNKDKGLVGHPVYGQIVKQHENGYVILQQLLVYAGHPLLEAFPTTPMEPRQLADKKLADYIIDWTGYCLNRALYGQHLNDRYFLQQFLRNLHFSLKDIADYVEREESLCHPDEPLPYTLSPEGLFSTILQRAKHLGKPHLALQSPRETQRSSASIRELSLSDMDPDLLVAALGSVPRDTSCFLCGNPDHLATVCPRLDAIRQDAFKSRLVLGLLKPKLPQGAPRGARSTRRVRALTNGGSDDDTHSDDSTVAHDNVADDPDDFASPAPDFP
jgi:DNA-binding transcriptional MerR regulator